MYAQLIADDSGKTLAAASTLDKEVQDLIKDSKKSTKSVDAAKAVGSVFAKRALAVNVTEVKFDRNGFLYTGRIKAVAEGSTGSRTSVLIEFYNKLETMKFDKLLESRRVRPEELTDITEKTVAINRVVKVVKGGRRFSFSALVVAGDGRGHVGFGLGKAGEVPDALKKANEASKKGLIRVPLRGTTIPHDIIGTFGATKVIMKPAAPGTGVIAGSAARAVIELSGIKDIRTKVIGSTNEHNVLHAVMMGLLLLKEPSTVAAKRGSQLEDIGYTSAH